MINQKEQTDDAFPCTVMDVAMHAQAKNISLYEIRKERARQEAIEWQMDFENHDYSLQELFEAQMHFTKLARRYGLTDEFIENGIPCLERTDDEEDDV